MSMIVNALEFPGNDAGQKISAAILALTPGIGGLVNAYFPNPQNCTGFTVPSGVTVQLSPALFTLIPTGPSITVQQGGRLYGSGTNSPGSTTLKAFTGFNKDIIRCINSSGNEDSDYWHHGIVSDLRIDGNKAGNTLGNGIALFGLAEVSEITRCNIFNCAQSGLYIKGSQSGTGSVRNMTVNGNSVAGIHVDEFRSGLTLYNVGGDANATTVLVTNPRLGGGALHISDLKSEACVGPVVTLSGGNSRMIFSVTGGNFLSPAGVESIGIRISADMGIDPLILLHALTTGSNMPILIDNQRQGTQFRVEGTAYHGRLEYCGGISAYFDYHGVHISP